MKEHILREMVNELRDIAVEYHGHQCLRQLILQCVTRYQQKDVLWWENQVVRK